MSPRVSETPDVSQEFNSQALPLKDFFSQGRVGFYIPLYQREYSWDVDNVEQLMDDLVKGIESMLSDSGSVSFLGTVILCPERQRKKIKPVDVRALPGQIYNVIDGQQRISTLAMLATRLYRKTHDYLKKIEGDKRLWELSDYLKGRQSSLADFFSFELSTSMAEPKRKPVIIRGNKDEWTLCDGDDKYRSPVSNYLATFIRNIDEGGVDIPDKRTSFGRNLKTIDNYLDAITSAHKQKETKIHYPDATDIIAKVSEDLIWEYERPDLTDILSAEPRSGTKHGEIAIGVQFCIFFHYLFERACVSMIEPTSDDWAFDIFQSLNATGTPLTAIETFKPLVVNTVSNFDGSKSDEYFRRVDGLFLATDTVEKKAKLTKEFLNVFSLMCEGRSLSSHFSAQRKWLNKRYEDLGTAAEKEEFIHRLADTADYWVNVKSFDHRQLKCYYGLSSLTEEEKQLALLCVTYLDDAGHRMADTILGRYYALVLRGASNSVEAFLQVSKAISAFFTLWRAVSSNAGLDEVYRRMLSPREELGASKSSSVPDMAWGANVSASDIPKLKAYLRSVLEQEKQITSREAWVSRAKTNLKYDSAKTVCKIALLISAHETINDASAPGLVKRARHGVNPCFDHDNWISPELKSIEHIAPQKDTNGYWDQDIYSKQLEHSVGNLILLPTVVNSSASNRQWEEKILYYKHLAQSDSTKLQALEDQAINKGITLAPETINLLTSAKHSIQVQPLVEYSVKDSGRGWTSDIIESRAERISELVWDKLRPWLDD